MKMPKTLFYSPSKGVVEEIETDKYLKTLKKDLGVDKGDDFDGLLKVATDDRYDLAVDDETPAKERKRLEKIVEGIRDCFEKSEEFKKEMEAEAEKAKAQEAKKGELIHAAVEEGLVVSGEWMAPALNIVQKNLGKKFVFTEIGVTKAKGAQIDEVEYSKAISQLSNGTVKTEKFNTSLGWGLGDICLMSKEAGDGSDEDMERIVAQAVEVTGKAKHTVQKTMNLCAKVSHAMRKKNPNFSFTLWQEYCNYQNSFPSPEAAEKFLNEVSKLPEVPSCAAMREALQEATGKKIKPPKPAGGHHYLYLSGNEAWLSNDISLAACADAEMTVIDLKLGSFLNGDGEPATKLKELPKKWFKEAPAPKEESKDDDMAGLPQ